MKTFAKLYLLTFAALFLLLAYESALAGCDRFTPQIDPEPYPCHDPQSQWCDERGTSCCKVWEACQPGGLCENQGFTARRLPDGGAAGGDR